MAAPLAEPTVLLFGDATDSWTEGLDQICRQAASKSWLRSYLDQLADTINAEIRASTLDRTLQENLGHFSSIQELAERYRHRKEELGVVQALLLHALRTATLLQWVEREPHLISPESTTEWLGFSGGLLTASVMAIATNFEELHEACLETARFVFRVAKLVSVRSRAVEDQPGTWGWAVLGISPEALRTALDDFQRSNGIPSAKRAKLAVAGAGWSTVVGPPSVLKLVMNQCKALSNLAKNPLEIKALQHTLETLTEEELQYMVGKNTSLLDRPIKCPSRSLWGMDNPTATYANFGALLKDVCLQVLGRPLDIPKVVSELSSKLDGARSVRIVQSGASSHAPYMASVLKTPGRAVTVLDPHSLLKDDDSAASLMAGRIAIVGMSGRGPGCDNVDEFWDIIMSKQDLCTVIPKDRFDIDEFYCEAHERGDKRCKMTTKYGCFMDNPGHFDSRFFHISPREALLMDPNHRQFLTSSYEALENAGYSDGRSRTTDPNRIAAFFAQATDDWHKQTHPTLKCDSYTLQGIQRAFGAGRLAWQFKWEGPTYAFDAACAGTTAGIHLACMSLLSRDIDMAVAGAANILSWPHSFTCLSDSGILSDTGNCKPWRDDADGYCRADFVGAVVLKRLEDAVAHNDNILAVVASSGRNHSGNSTSITTSDAGAQERLFRKVMQNANASPDDFSYVEMHGTGTQTGDPAEMGAVANTFKHRSRRNGPLPIGGVKANVGHGEAAAGMAELLKCIMMFQKDIIPPQAGMPHALNPKLPPLSDINIEIPSEPRVFNKHKEANKPRRILLNNFDAAGGNACMVLEDYTRPQVSRSADPRTNHVVVISARTSASLPANRKRLIQWLHANPTARIEDIAYTTTARRMHHPLRAAAAASSVPDLIQKLEAQDKESAQSSSSLNPPVVFVFTGQGSHYAGMGAELYRTSSVFRETVDLCVSICQENKFPPFLDIITNDTVDLATQDSAQTQLAVITLEIALTAFWRSVGIEPAMVMGHSLGEYAALHAAGVLSLSDTLYLIGNRALMLLERCEAGSCAMLAVSTSVNAVQEQLKKMKSSSCDIACINSPSATVVSGSAEDLAQLQAGITASDRKVRTTALPVPFAFHSFQMDPILQDFAALAGGVTYSAPKIPVASTLLASIIDKPGVFNQDYLAQQTRHSVDFVGALKSVQKKLRDPVWLEIGPGPVCASFVGATLAPSPPRIMYTLERKSTNWTSISRALASAFTNGITVDWLAFHKTYESNLELLTLPGYAWDMKNYWVTFTEEPVQAVAEKRQIEAPQPLIGTCAQYLVSKSSSPKIEVTLRALISDPEFLALIDGHRMQQVGLASGSVFCDAALTAAKCAIDHSGRKGVTTRSLTLHDPELLAPLTRALVGVDGELFTTAVMDSPTANSVLVSFKASSSSASHDLGSIRVGIIDVDQTQAEWDRVSYFIKAKMDERIRLSKEGLGHRMHPDVIYALFAKNVEFSPPFKGIQEGYISADFEEAAAEVILKPDPVGSRFTFSPYWSEALAHLAGFMVNGNPNRSPEKTFIVMGFASVEQTVDFEPGKRYFTYTRVSRWEENTAFCDAFIFDAASSKLVMKCVDLRYMELPRATWRHILGGGGHGASTGAKHSQKAPAKKVEHVPAADDSKPAKQPVIEAQPQEEKKADSGLFDLIISTICKATGSDPSDFDDNTLIADLGVDSIMGIEVVSAVNAETGIELSASFVFDYPTIGDLRREFGGQKSSPETEAVPVPPPESEGEASDPESLDGVVVSAPESVASSGVNIPTPCPGGEEDITVQDGHYVDESQPQPSVRITLLKGRPGAGKTPLYLMADGTGSIATYIHLPPLGPNTPIYGVDSPFRLCPSRLTPELGVEGVAKYIVDALIKAHPTGPFLVGGFSAGSIVAFEVARQLPTRGRKVDGLLIMDLCCPRPAGSLSLSVAELNQETDNGIAVFSAATASDGLWATTDLTKEHLRAYLVAMRRYHPPPMTADTRPTRSAVIWAEKGLVNRVKDDANALKLLKEAGIPTKAYPGFMEDPKLGPFACLIPDKTEADLGPNGWDKYVGDILTLHVDGDHLDLPMPRHVHLLHEQLQKVIAYFES